MQAIRGRASVAILAAVFANGAALAQPGAAAAGAAQPAPTAQAQRPALLRVAMTGSYWPLHQEVAPGEREGLEAELARDVARLLGMRVLFLGRAEMGAGAIEAVAAGKADIAMSTITPTDERRKLVDFTKPYLVLHYRMAAREADAAAALEPTGKRVAVPRGPAIAVLKALLPRARAVEVASAEAAVQALVKGSVDLAFGEDAGMVLAVEGRPLRLAGPPLGESPIAIAVPKGRAARYDEALAKLSGRIADLVEKYRPGEPVPLPRDVYVSFSAGIEPEIVHVVREPLAVTLERPDEEVKLHSIGDDIEISVPAWKVTAAPPAVQRRAGKHLHAPQAATWVRLADGTFIGFEQTMDPQQCGGQETGPDGKVSEYSYDCPNHEYRFVAVRGDEVDSVTFTVMEGT